MFYTRNDVDLFQILEDSTCRYKADGPIYIIGDLNARCGVRDDFIENDNLHVETIDFLAPIINYETDINLQRRNCMDKSVNQFGRKLLEFCKTSGLRIVNGRHKNDSSGNVTFFSTAGISMIDYVLTKPQYFSSIWQFTSGVFNTFSDHAPICLTIVVSCICNDKDDNTRVEQNTCIRTHSTSVTWDDENTQVIGNCIADHTAQLCECLDIPCDTLNDVNNCVNSFCSLLNEIVLPHCNVREGTHKTTSKRKKSDNIDKPWFNDACEEKYIEYKKALHNFNINKSPQNQENLTRKKSEYKKLSSKLKRSYKR